ncbi:response regulator [bacterium]|nr:response regulator [bacterium]
MAITKVTEGVRTLGTGEVATANMATDPTNASNLSSGSVPTAQLGNVDTTTLEDDIAILGFKVATNGSLAKYNLVDQTEDAFEDEEDLLEIISDTLIKLDANFITAKNGQEAFDILSESPVDVVITDINMPIMNGLDLIERMNKLYPKIQVIVMSAHTEIEYINRANDLGVRDYLIKPFDFIKFIELVATMDS